jgi:hypothetical protein
MEAAVSSKVTAAALASLLLALLSFSSARSAEALAGSLCAAWTGEYSGSVRSDQDLMGVSQTVELSIDKGSMSGVIKVDDGLTISLWSTKMRCGRDRLLMSFEDNSGGGGRLLISKKAGYQLFFSNPREGDRRNYEGYFPESKIDVERSGLR